MFNILQVCRFYVKMWCWSVPKQKRNKNKINSILEKGIFDQSFHIVLINVLEYNGYENKIIRFEVRLSTSFILILCYDI